MHTTTHAADAELIKLGNQLAAAIRFAQDAFAGLAARPAGFWEGEQSAIDAAMAPSDAIVAKMEPLKASSMLGLLAKEMAARWAVGEVMGAPHADAA